MGFFTTEKGSIAHSHQPIARGDRSVAVWRDRLPKKVSISAAVL